MKKYWIPVLAILLCAVFFGCASPAGSDPGASATPVTPAPVTPTPSPTPSAQDDVLDMKAFLDALVEAYPDAGAERLCRAILESPYFALFSAYDPEYFFPFAEYGYKPSGLRESYYVTDMSFERTICVMIPDDKTDPEAFVEEFKKHAYLDATESAPNVLIEVIGGKVFFAKYSSDMRPVYFYAKKARDYAEMFHSYRAEHPDAGCAEIARYFTANQKIAEMFTKTVTEGTLHGFGVWNESIGWYEAVEITGFSDGAMFEPQMEPNALLGYVFRVRDGEDIGAFTAMLRKNANLAYNVCTSVNTIITETDGSFVLFILCDEIK